MVRRLFRDALPLKRGEWGLALFLYFLLTVMVGTDWIGKLGADALFVKRYGIEKVPWMYILTPIAMLAVSALIFFFIDRMRRRTMLLVYVASVTVFSIALQYAINETGVTESIVQPISYIFAHGVKETIYILFWVYAGNLYDAEQSKRLFPFFAGSVLVGKILGGFAGAAIAPIIHAENFIGAQAVGFGVCFIALLLYRGLPEGKGGKVDDKHRPGGVRATISESVDGYKAVASDPLMRTFGVGVFFWYFLMQFANFLYLLGLDQSTQNASAISGEDTFAVLYGSVYTSSSLVALFIQSFMTTGLLRRFGVVAMLFVVPLWYIATYGWAAATITFDQAKGLWELGLLAGIALQLGERIWIPAIHRPAAELVYSQVAASIRPRARAFLSGGVNAIGNMFAAVGLIVGLKYSDTQTLLATGAALSVVYLYNTAHVRRIFGQRIAQNLVSPDPDLRRNAADMLSSEPVPEESLRALGNRIPADVEHGVHAALTRRGILAVAADVTE